ncbi:2-dehydropantoate 2-reductase [Hazenella sp. IB182357]|uniref:2-dehydropantoate 2-reductase n=1 Tax=Polycladospora coralii TaxID=2771432 RepID=A0A926N8J2_9BACL|nr:2-dehydropantoate 2-reductase [Polycladospora coralii]MBD1371307.1 2-dehydropantoate 2-reductase [Polycladospora coralii]
MMKIGVLGCGSIGLLWSSRVVQMDHQVILIPRTSEQKKVLHAFGLFSYDLSQQVTHYPICAQSVADIEPGSIDILFVTVKNTQLSSVISHIQQLTNPQTQILFFQNGLGQEKVAGALHDRPWTYLVVTSEGALRKEVNHIYHTGRGEVWIGLYSDREQEIHQTMSHFLKDSFWEAVEVNWQSDVNIMHRIWEKLLINSVINPLTAIHQITNGQLLESTYDEKREQLIRESIAVAHVEGYAFSYEQVKEKVESICRHTAENHSSMLQDLQRGNKTEIESINGAIIRLANQHHIFVPTHEEMRQLVKEKEALNRC